MSFWKKNRSEPLPIRTQDLLPGYMTGATRNHAIEAISLRKAAGISLQKFPTLKRQWAVYSALDISYSMDGYIGNGSLGRLVEAISTVAHEGGWDSDNIIPAFPYGQDVAAYPYMIELGQHENAGREIVQHGQDNDVNRGGTNFAPPVSAIMDHYRASGDWGNRPALAFIQTDGLNNDMRDLVHCLEVASQDPIHWVFVYFGMVDMSAEGRDNAANLRKLDVGSVMPNRIVDNVSVFIAGPDPLRVTATELTDGLLVGPNQWLREAESAGIIPR